MKLPPSPEGIAHHRAQGASFEDIARTYGIMSVEAYIFLRQSGLKDPGTNPPFADCTNCAAHIGVPLSSEVLMDLRRHIYEDHGIGQ